MTASIFISYSSSDASLVAPIVSLLRASGTLVFRDADSIPPGAKWRQEIVSSITASNLVAVFWCGHSSKSKQVAQEFTQAIELDKKLVPILLDETPLPESLTAYQWIDFRTLVAGHHAAKTLARATDSDHSSEASPRRWTRAWIALAATSALVVAAILAIGILLGAPFATPPISDLPGDADIRPVIDLHVEALVVLGLVVAAAIACAVLAFRWPAARRRRVAAVSLVDLRRKMAATIIDEITKQLELDPA
jgi:TIR domain-containing protein